MFVILKCHVYNLTEHQYTIFMLIEQDSDKHNIYKKRYLLFLTRNTHIYVAEKRGWREGESLHRRQCF